MTFVCTLHEYLTATDTWQHLIHAAFYPPAYTAFGATDSELAPFAYTNSIKDLVMVKADDTKLNDLDAETYFGSKAVKDAWIAWKNGQVYTSNRSLIKDVQLSRTNQVSTKKYLLIAEPKSGVKHSGKMEWGSGTTSIVPRN